MGQGSWDISAVAFGSQRRRSVLCNLIIAQIMFALSFLPAAVVVAVVSMLIFTFLLSISSHRISFSDSTAARNRARVGFEGDC